MWWQAAIPAGPLRSSTPQGGLACLRRSSILVVVIDSFAIFQVFQVEKILLERPLRRLLRQNYRVDSGIWLHCAYVLAATFHLGAT